MTGAGGLLTLLRGQFAEEVGAGKGATRSLASFDRAAMIVLGRLLDGLAAQEAKPERKKRVARRVNGAEIATSLSSSPQEEG